MKEWIEKCLFIKKWKPSLIRNKVKLNLSEFQNPKESLFIVGDIVNGSSRVTGAI